MRRLSMYSEYFTGDLNEEDVDFRIDLADLEFEDESFDMIICNHVLEHVTDDRLALRELARVTRSGGIAVMMTPVDDSYQTTYEDPKIVDHRERHLHFGQWDHVRRYGRDFYERISEAGFDVERWHAAPEDEAKYGLFVGEDVIVGRKRAKD